ncbi:MAG: hypothetical protein HY869_01145 [Chloroflexi bacterium]|nr:hypothetical protein [Chloroflexota bacterium]
MKKYLKNSFVIIFLVGLLVSCNNAENIQTLPTQEFISTPTFISISHTPTPTLLSATATETPYPTTPAQATIEAFGALCIGAKKISSSEISPDGKWIAAMCYDENGKGESPLQIVSIDRSQEWKIYYNNYAKSGLFGDRHDGIIPYRWSKDGKFLYAVAGSRLSGCCWIGGKYVLLVRLSLETGEQIEIINGTDFGSDPPFSFTISEDDRYLLFTPITDQTYDIAVLDLLSNEIRTVRLENPKPINLEYAVLSPDGNIIVMPLFRNIEFNDYLVEEIALIDLALNQQKTLISDLGENGELYPIRWIDENHVLLCSKNPSLSYNQSTLEYWSLNISTGLRERVEKP